jgi:hypothetical protein
MFSIKKQFRILKSNFGDTAATVSKALRDHSDVCLTRAGRKPSVDANACYMPRRRSPSIHKLEEELIIPVRQGTLRVLRMARNAGRENAEGCWVGRHTWLRPPPKACCGLRYCKIARHRPRGLPAPPRLRCVDIAAQSQTAFPQDSDAGPRRYIEITRDRRSCRCRDTTL